MLRLMANTIKLHKVAHALLHLAALLQVRARLAAAAGVDSSDHSTSSSTHEQQQQLQQQQVPHALLLLSGSHPLRALWWLRRMDAVAQLKLATDMKRTGHLPDTVALWAVANPIAADQDAELKRYVTIHKQNRPMCTTYTSLPLCQHLCKSAIECTIC
jgi:hypothetical protein